MATGKAHICYNFASQLNSKLSTTAGIIFHGTAFLFFSYLGIILLEYTKAVPPKDCEHAVLEAQDHEDQESNASEISYVSYQTDPPSIPTGTTPVPLLLRRIDDVTILVGRRCCGNVRVHPWPIVGCVCFHYYYSPFLLL